MDIDDSPFTPWRLVPPDLFIGREEEIGELMGAVRWAFKQKSPRVMFIVGERGIGKSSLASVVRKLAEAKEKALTAHIQMKRVDSLSEMMRQVFERLLKDNVYQSWFGKLRALFGERVRSVGWGGVNVEFMPKPDDHLENNFPEITLEVLDKVKGEKRGILLIWDEVNGMAQQEDFAYWLKSTIDEIATSGIDLPLCLVLVGTEEQRRQIIANHKSLDRVLRVVDIYPWSNEETEQFYRDRFKFTNKVSLTDKALEMMVHYTSGLPALAQEIGNAVWRQAPEEGEIRVKEANGGIIKAAEEIGCNRIEPRIIKALKSENYQVILKKIPGILFDDGIRFSRKDLNDKLTELERAGLDNFLQRMCKLGGLLRDEGGEQGVYRFPTRLEAVYHIISTSERKR